MERKRFLVALASVAAAVLVTAVPPTAGAATNTSIRSVDFLNFTYDLGEGEVVTITEGDYFRDEPDDKLFLEVVGVDYGDFDTNKVEEAAVWLRFNSGGTGQFTFTQVFKMAAGKPVKAAESVIGDRADGGLHDVLTDAGQLVEDRYTAGAGACCPNTITRFRFRLQGTRLVKVGTPTRRSFIYLSGEELSAPVAVKFLKGSSSATVAIDEGLRVDLTLAARAGQMLILKPVSAYTDSGAVSVTVFDNGKKIATNNGKAITIKLPTGKIRLDISGSGYLDIAIK
jgi:hypothetical protein